MNKRKAIKILKRQKESMLDEYARDFIWISTTLSHFEYFFGKESHEYVNLKSFNHLWRADTHVNEINFTRQRLAKTLDEAIYTIKNRGVLYHPKENIIKRIPDAHWVWILPLAIATIFGTGYATGFAKGEYDRRQLKIRIESFDVTGKSSTPANYIPTQITDETNKKDSSKK